MIDVPYEMPDEGDTLEDRMQRNPNAHMQVSSFPSPSQSPPPTL